jgi:hypothetical protein
MAPARLGIPTAREATARNGEVPAHHGGRGRSHATQDEVRADSPAAEATPLAMKPAPTSQPAEANAPHERQPYHRRAAKPRYS